MTTDANPIHSASTRRAIVQGDQLARQCDWTESLVQWRNALNGPDSREAARRIHWFLRETGSSVAESSGRYRRGRAHQAFLLAALLGFAGTAVTLGGFGRSGATSAALSLLAWACYLGAMALALVGARLLSAVSRHTASLGPRDDTMRHAQETAAALDRFGCVGPEDDSTSQAHARDLARD